MGREVGGIDLVGTADRPLDRPSRMQAECHVQPKRSASAGCCDGAGARGGGGRGLGGTATVDRGGTGFLRNITDTGVSMI